jgi:hypothetical protein
MSGEQLARLPLRGINAAEMVEGISFAARRPPAEDRFLKGGSVRPYVVTATAQTLRPSRGSDVLFITFSTVLGWWAFTQTSPRGPAGAWIGAWFLVAVATYAVVVKVLSLVTDWSCLRIEGEGFRLRRGNREEFFPWVDVTGFRVGKHGSKRVVCFDYCSAARHKYPARSLPEGYAEGDEQIVDDYRLKPDALADISNRRRVEGLESARVASARD